MKKLVLEFPESWSEDDNYSELMRETCQDFANRLAEEPPPGCTKQYHVIGLPPGVRVVELDVPDEQLTATAEDVEHFQRWMEEEWSKVWKLREKGKQLELLQKIGGITPEEARILDGDPSKAQPLGTIFASDPELKGLEEKLTDAQRQWCHDLFGNKLGGRRAWVEKELAAQLRVPEEIVDQFKREMTACPCDPEDLDGGGRGVCERCQQRWTRIAELMEKPGATGQKDYSVHLDGAVHVLTPEEHTKWMAQWQYNDRLWQEKKITLGQVQDENNKFLRELLARRPVETTHEGMTPQGMSSYICPSTAHWEPEVVQVQREDHRHGSVEWKFETSECREPEDHRHGGIELRQTPDLERSPIACLVPLLPESKRDTFLGWDKLWTTQRVDGDRLERYQRELCKMLLGQQSDHTIIAEAFEVGGRKTPESVEVPPLFDKGYGAATPDEPWTPGRKWL